MTAMRETLPTYHGTLPEAPDDLRALDEQMPDVTNVYGTIPYQEKSMSGDLPMQGTLEVPKREDHENFSGTIDVAELATDAAQQENPSTQKERTPRQVPEANYDGFDASLVNLYKDFRIFAANPNTPALRPEDKSRLLQEVRKYMPLRSADFRVYRDPTDTAQTPRKAVEYPYVFTFNDTLRGGFEDTSKESDAVLFMHMGDKAGGLTHVLIQTEDGHDLILHKTSGSDVENAKDQTFTLLTTKTLDAKGHDATATTVKSEALKDIILVPGEPISTDFGLTEEQKGQLPSGRVTRIIGLALDDKRVIDSAHPRTKRPGLQLKLDPELLAALPNAEERIPSVQGTLDGAEGLLPSTEAQTGPTPQAPETQVPDPNRATTPSPAPGEPKLNGTLPPRPPMQRRPRPVPEAPQPPVQPQTEMFSIPAEPARYGLSAAELNKLLDSDDPADRARALAETRRQNQNDGTRIMPENLKDFTPKDVGRLSEPQIFSISPQQASQMNRRARRTLQEKRNFFQERQQDIVNLAPDAFRDLANNIGRVYGRLTEGAKGAYQIRLVGDATPADLARINPNQLTVPDARKLYDERRRILEEQGYGF